MRDMDTATGETFDGDFNERHTISLFYSLPNRPCAR
jgi:hypothetical protein